MISDTGDLSDLSATQANRRPKAICMKENGDVLWWKQLKVLSFRLSWLIENSVTLQSWSPTELRCGFIKKSKSWPAENAIYESTIDSDYRRRIVRSKHDFCAGNHIANQSRNKNSRVNLVLVSKGKNSDHTKPALSFIGLLWIGSLDKYEKAKNHAVSPAAMANQIRCYERKRHKKTR